MEIIDRQSFFTWAEGHSLGISKRYPASQTLSFNGSPDSWARWSLEDDNQLAQTLRAALRCFGPSDFCWLRRKYDSWNFQRGADSNPFEDMIATFVVQLGIPLVFQGVVKVHRPEYDKLLLLSYLLIKGGVSAFTDIELVTGDGQYILCLGHHNDEIIVSCASDEILDSFIVTMEALGFPVD